MTPQFTNALQQIIDTQYYDKTAHTPWDQTRDDIINQIVEICNKFDQKSIKLQADKIIEYLTQHFTKCPPFTIPRVSELVLDPKKEGYDIDTATGTKKYLNALTRIVFVSSTIEDFPRPTNTETKRNNDDIPLVKIPWLSDFKKDNKRDKDDRDGESDEEHETKRSRADSSNNSIDEEMGECGC